MKDIGSTRKERSEYAKKNRNISVIVLMIVGIIASPYSGSLLMELFNGMMVGNFEIVKFDFGYNYLFVFKYLFRNVISVDTVVMERGLSVLILSSVMLIWFIWFSISIFWRTNRLKRFSREESELGTPESAGSGEHGTARWQTGKEKKETTFIWDTSEPLNKAGIVVGSRIEIGKKGIIGAMRTGSTKKEVFNLLQGDEHCIMWATTRLGKSRKEVLPLIWTCAQAGESMVINDPKGELYASASEYLTSIGYNVICVNFRDPLKGNKWNLMWLVNRYVDFAKSETQIVEDYKFKNGIDSNSNLPPEIRTHLSKHDSYISKATEVAGDMAYSIANQSGSKGSSEPIWENGEKSVITALVLCVAMESKDVKERHMTSVYNLLAEYGAPDEDGEIPLNIFIDSLDTGHPAKRAFAVAKLAPEKTRGSFFTQTLTDLRLFADPEISDMTNDIDHDMFLFGTERTAVFMVVPDDKMNRNVLASIYSDQVYVSSVEVANRYGGRLPIRIRNIYDEFGNMPHIVNFASKITVGGGRGILFVLILQNYSQLEEKYDKNADTIVGNCHTWLYLGTHEPKVAEIISKMTGTYTVEADGFNASFAENQTTSVGSSLNLVSRALLTQDEVIKWDKKRIMVFRIGLHPSYYELGDISLFKANEDYGFESLEGARKMVIDIAENTQKAYNYFPKLTEQGYEYVSNLALTVKAKYAKYDALEFASTASQFTSISKWDRVPYRQLEETSLFEISKYNVASDKPIPQKQEGMEVGRNLFGASVTTVIDTNDTNDTYEDDETEEDETINFLE